MEIFKYTADMELENMRIDRYLKKLCKDEPALRIYKALKNGDVRINGKKVKENYRISLNDVITVRYLNTSERKWKIEKGINADFTEYKKRIIFENEDFFIVNKPGNIPMHKGTGHEYGISEIYKNIFENENINFANRIDLETSGLVIGCKTKRYLRYISEKIRNNEIIKRYIAVVHGTVIKDSFSVDNYLKTVENGVKVSDAQDKESKRAVTHFKKAGDINLELAYDRYTVLDVELITGRKHQIRVQLSNVGYPIIGDKKYGIGDGSEKFYLCCYRIAFDSYNFSIIDEIFK